MTLKRFLLLVAAAALFSFAAKSWGQAGALPFSPETSRTVSLSVTTTSANVNVTTAGLSGSFLVANAGASTAFYKCGTGTQTATTSDTPILPSKMTIIARSGTETNCAAITASSTATLYFTPGYGNLYPSDATGNIVFSASPGQILTNTADEADDVYTCMSGGGECLATRGSYVRYNGNEHASSAGDLYLSSGSISDGGILMWAYSNITMNPSNNTSVFFNYYGSSSTDHIIAYGDNGTTAGQNLFIGGSGGANDDDGYACIGGGSACSTVEGAFIKVSGEQRSTADSGITLNALTSLAAAGADQASATQLEETISMVTTGTGGVKLKATPELGMFEIIHNSTGSAINVYPGTGDQIQNTGSANTPVGLASQAMMLCIAHSSSLWGCGEMAAP